VFLALDTSSDAAMKRHASWRSDRHCSVSEPAAASDTRRASQCQQCNYADYAAMMLRAVAQAIRQQVNDQATDTNSESN
jgi:hypothetical protein